MKATPEKKDLASWLKIFSDFYDGLKLIYKNMDDQYQKVSKGYAFECKGCTESCCETRFYHHTYGEYLYLLTGFQSLDGEHQKKILEKAVLAQEKQKMADGTDTPIRVMCPLNEYGLCGIYDYRPMICRLHGIPHELHKPGQNSLYGSGCRRFAENCQNKPYIPFDRTPFYREMAIQEQKLRESLKMGGKIKMTITEMLLQFK